MENFINKQVAFRMELEGATGRELAELLGITPGYFSKKLKSKKTFSRAELEVLGERLGVDFLAMVKNPMLARTANQKPTIKSKTLGLLDSNIQALNMTRESLIQEISDLRELIESKNKLIAMYENAGG